MFHIIALTLTLFNLTKGTGSDAFHNGTKDRNSSEPLRLGDLWLYDATLNTTEPQWRCRAINSTVRSLKNLSQTLDVRVECKRLRQGPENIETKTEPPTQRNKQENDFFSDFRMIFLMGAAAGAVFVVIVAVTVSIVCCCAKKRKTQTLVDRLKDDESKYAVTDKSISVNNETTQPLYENTNNADSIDSNDAVLEVESTAESDYLTPVDSQTEIRIIIAHENDGHKTTNEAPIYTNHVTKARLALPTSTTPANRGNKKGESGAEEQVTAAQTESEKSTFQTRNSGKNRYQDLKYPVYQNCAQDRGIYMSLLKENDKNDDQSRMRAPSEVAYVNLSKKSSPLWT